MFLNKRWLIKCTCPLFHSIYKTKVCVRNHPHTVIQGKDASIAHAWKEQVFPVRWINKLLLVDGSNEDGVRFDTETMDLQPVFGEPVPDDEDTLHGHPSSSSSKWSPVSHGRWEKTAGNSSAELHDGKNYEPTPKEVAQWDVQLLKFHKASGHPSNRNLARIIKEAGKQEWQVQRAHQLRCSACEAVKLGGSSSGKVPPAAMSSPPKAWSTVLVDIGEWTMMARKQKLKFMMVIDGATKFKATHLIMTYSLIEQGNENAQQVIEGFSHCWLADKTRPMIVIPGNASTLRSTAFREFCDNNNNIWLSFPVEKEPWAHGIAERGIQELKLVMDKIYIEDATLSAATILSLATSSLNAVENVHGFSPFQWAYGQSFHWTDEDVVTHAQLRDADELADFWPCGSKPKIWHAKFMQNMCYQSSRIRALESPFGHFLHVWKKMLPHEAHKGKISGYTKSAKAHWIGPGSAWQSHLSGTSAGTARSGSKTCGVGRFGRPCPSLLNPSVRPLTDQEQVIHELTKGTWRDGLALREWSA